MPKPKYKIIKIKRRIRNKHSYNEYDKKLFRCLYLLHMLNENRCIKPAVLAEEFNVTARSVQRDLELLDSSGFPLVYDENGYRFMDGFTLQKIAVTPQEKFLLNTFYGLFSKTGTSFDSVAKSFLNKVLFTPKSDDSAPADSLTNYRKKIIKESMKELSRALPARLEDLTYPPNFVKKINEFLNVIDDKLRRLRKQDKVNIGFRRHKPCDRYKPVAVISVPKTYFRDPYLKLDFCDFEKNRDFELIANLPYENHQAFMIELRLAMSFNFWGPHLKSRQMTYFDDFASYLGFTNTRKEFNYQSAYGNDKGWSHTSSFIHWKEELPMPEEDIKPFLNKTGGFITFGPVSKKKLKK